MNIFSVPEAIKSFHQFVVWKLIPDKNGGKAKKLPFDPKTGRSASTTDPTTWSDYDTACKTISTHSYSGIGFVFTANDPFIFIDIDNCRNTETGEWLPYAQEAVSKLGGIWETSRSGNGLHGILWYPDKASFLKKRNRWTNDYDHSYEFYADKRYVALGKCDWVGDIFSTKTEEVHKFIPDKTSNNQNPIEWKDETPADYGGPLDDNELIQQALSSKGGPSVMFCTAASFKALWNADEKELGKFYPDSGNRPFDRSSADQALANQLAWWTGCNPARIEKLMNMSPLCQRDKWRDRPDYRRRTIGNAISGKYKNYIKKNLVERQQRLENDIRIGSYLPLSPLPIIMNLTQMHNDLVYIGDGNQIVHRPSKMIRSKEDARGEFAASITEVNTGKFDVNGPVLKKCSTLNLWISSPYRISVDVVTWQPGKDEICLALEKTGHGMRGYNLWIPIQLLSVSSNWQEWVKPFLNHIAYLVPIESERNRFLQWLAHIMQKPGELPHTCYLFVAVSTGIGRGTLMSILTRVFRGYVAANIDPESILNKGFNGRLSQKLLATVDEIREGTGHRYQQQENLKSAIVEEVRLINPKFGRQYIEKNCCRWLFCSNHFDAMPFDNSDRRVIVIENPTTPKEPEWYEYLHKLMDDNNFISSIQHYLFTFDISNFKPGERAPMNEAKIKALECMETDAEKAIKQFISQWPAELATVSDLRAFIDENEEIKSRAMGHLIQKYGMKTAKKIKVGTKSETLLIVRGNLRPKDVEKTSNSLIYQIISEARGRFGSQ